MGKLAAYKYVAAMFLVAQFVLTVFTFVALFGGDVSPIGNSARAMLVYVLPLLIGANLLLLVYWLVRRKWFYALVPIVTVACCIPYIGTIIQPPFGSNDVGAQNGIRIATYNVAMFNRETSGFMAQDILAEMRTQKVDVLCMQEYNETSGDKKNSESYKEYFPYMAVGRNDMVIFSRYPITQSKTLLFEETNNSAMWADIDVKGNELRVFNVHLQTTGINRTMHQADKLMRQNYDVSTNRLLEAIYGNYMLGMYFRVGQATTVANEVRESKNSVILCGDFNDVPYSYVYNTMLGNMVDGFKECGKGWMKTYRGKKPVRIDYIFHDQSLKGLTYYRTGLSYSDHYPVFMKIAL
ncbi:MAG: endonuclease/exonuclease/phosphatase family protein [Prevotella sp.]|nr:endonuclease/exonuclease/phosphatase family protein [Prevotella sp.]MBQ9202637.1 endonuclease/exonuclease/phosphatase family protein [Prevotella sp.]